LLSLVWRAIPFSDSVPAIGQGFEAVTCLDVDNRYLENHISWLAGLHNGTGAELAAALQAARERGLHHLAKRLQDIRRERQTGKAG
jgi:hypothetical protein